jgi:hypothetical protein
MAIIEARFNNNAIGETIPETLIVGAAIFK